MHFSVLAAFTVALAIAVALPGPGIFAVVSCAIGRGFREALAMIGGLILGDLIYFTLAVLGMAALARSMGELFIAVKLTGAAYLIWLGVKLWRERPAALVSSETAGPGKRGYRRSFVGGFLVTISNPKTIAFYAGLLPTFIDLGKISASDAVAMAGIVVLTVGAIPAVYAYAAASSRRFFNSPSRLRLLNRTAGTMLIGSGVTVATR
ncbi:LysE family translocator [Oleiharenicola lentus]|uniref:LysE family translocator n=1 Tax=Oleiharenicola lentus TaxID=2508720 RepID=UPI003F6735A1